MRRIGSEYKAALKGLEEKRDHVNKSQMPSASSPCSGTTVKRRMSVHYSAMWMSIRQVCGRVVSGECITVQRVYYSAIQCIECITVQRVHYSALQCTECNTVHRVYVRLYCSLHYSPLCCTTAGLLQFQRTAVCEISKIREVSMNPMQLSDRRRRSEEEEEEEEKEEERGGEESPRPDSGRCRCGRSTSWATGGPARRSA